MSNLHRQCGVWLFSEDGVSKAHFGVFSRHASAVFLCLFDEEGREFSYPMKRRGDFWSLTLDGIAEGQAYGYRADGPWAPAAGHRFDPAKLLLDPYALAIDGLPKLAVAQAAQGSAGPQDPHFAPTPDGEDNAALMPRCRVVDVAALPPFVHSKPGYTMEESVIYELHVKGFSMGFPGVTPAHRGRFAALAAPDVIQYLKRLGVTAVELMPCQQFFDEPFLHAKGLSNYWGYNSIGFFAPHNAYGDIREFRAMVDALHGAGIEVILDVVYNHSAEGNAMGPVYSFKGLDNACYYRLTDSGHYINDTGCGNTLDLGQPRVLELVMDSLRYWAQVGGVDGFRFDLAACLGRMPHGFDTHSGFFAALGQDPVLKALKLIAEPWDVGPGGYRLGEFPAAFAEWNDKYRDAMRRLWRGDEQILGEFARRFHGSADLFEPSHRGPWASLNFIASHDGFTLRDLLSYEQRHNLANGEDNRDGHQENLSHNFGVEGEATELVAARKHKARAMLVTLFFSFGIPMLRAGDELWQTQQGNNNAYCQDNALTWIDWESADTELIDFVAGLIHIRRKLPLLAATRYIHGNNPDDGRKGPFLAWFNESGLPMAGTDWHRCGPLIAALGEHHPLRGSELLLMLINPSQSAVDISLPLFAVWEQLHSLCGNSDMPARIEAGDTLTLPGVSIWIFHGHRDADPGTQ
ncbi:glycogen debranching protein GlgX [Shewanella zhangzhouensis]|uniref:glycogen debranching protein GlgX n=1 Tax=Shewanella zhangzhouensis TaxID=2864213 RepID=UPI001C66236B|nr:glycogen debranching protein GlgX [Shewanella zhangzhouensis]QYK04121.1 glycogen debranching protein GlgX [Shewanella zhangzhouensis]